MSEAWVCVDTLQGRLEAEIVRGMLEAQEIEVQLSQESSAAIYGLGIGPLAEVEVFVREGQRAEAESLLDRYHRGTLEDESADE
jgi:hypothetical protein